ncbi:hypothetical protein B0I35DRAFT_434583 [Stachybotrys elegans]|uniref:Uncharacterized protein n=1 Tax=Stachybotrys elegans TaxID=80388 RepID=A0A8K0SQU2_9HYPO|nr:hypothetical protein B0I35DRAFT_434583 [Stachybotrys elegans]
MSGLPLSTLEQMGYLSSSSVQRPSADGWTDEQLHVNMVRATGRSERSLICCGTSHTSKSQTPALTLRYTSRHSTAISP